MEGPYAFWKANGIEIKEGEKNWGQYCLKRKDSDIAVTLFVFSELKRNRTGRAIDTALKSMEVWNGIEPTFDDYKKINREFEEQFID